VGEEGMDMVIRLVYMKMGVIFIFTFFLDISVFWKIRDAD
jgi:hypothetical protein